MAQNQSDPFLTEREFSRVDTCVPFEFRRIPKEEQVNLRSRISSEPSVISGGVPELDDEALQTWLKMLNSKLDTVLNYIMFQREGFSNLKMRPLNISGGGMSFTSNENYQIGEVLEIKMMLHIFQPVALFLYGKVVKIGTAGPGGQFDTAVQFIEIDDEIANTIVRFVFEVQRGQLRKRRD